MIAETGWRYPETVTIQGQAEGLLTYIRRWRSDVPPAADVPA